MQVNCRKATKGNAISEGRGLKDERSGCGYGHVLKPD